jgi:hypothetical protein
VRRGPAAGPPSPAPAGLRHGSSGGSGYLLLPRDRRRLDGCSIDDTVWAGLGVPVDLAFFTRSGESDDIDAGYPGPLGAMRSTVPADIWREVEACHPDLRGIAPDVQALLVNRAHGASEHWLVPLDDCYRLVAVVRAHWKGLGGGPEVWQRIDAFFHELTEPTQPTQPTRNAQNTQFTQATEAAERMQTTQSTQSMGLTPEEASWAST